MPGQASSSKKIFISYRHDDGVAMTDRIYRRLEDEFGKGTVFRDLDITPGANYLKSIDAAIAGCAFVLVVIGKKWLRPPVKTIKGQRVQERDVVMFEIESALEHGVQVIPVFVDGGKMPPQSKLPGNISTFHYRQGVKVGYEPHFDFDVGLLIKRLGPSLRSPPKLTSAIWSKWLPELIHYFRHTARYHLSVRVGDSARDLVAQAHPRLSGSRPPPTPPRPAPRTAIRR